ncbi:MAG: hypothetical protein ACT4P9_16975 [Betaproteobacteria bacterium]
MKAGRRALLALPLAALWARAFDALAAGSVEKGIHRIRGDVRVNGAPAKEGQDVRAGDVLTTGAASEAVFVTGKDAFLMREHSRVEVQGAAGSLLLTGLRIVSGAVLSVFSPGEAKTVRTPTATIGIRGTGAYVEALADRSYVCICYGEADIASSMDPTARETILTAHHEQPRYVMGVGAPQMLMVAPVINHTDTELEFLESLAGRLPPFLHDPLSRPGGY